MAVAQQSAQDFSRGRFRNCFDESDAVQLFVMGQLRSDIGLDLFLAGGRVLANDKGDGYFARLFIVLANHRRILNLWMGDQVASNSAGAT